MKNSFVACLAVLCLSTIPGRAASINLITVTNPPQGGTMTGAGVYPAGSAPLVFIQASNGWYLSNVTIDGVQSSHFAVNQNTVQNQGGDITTITNDTENYILNFDGTYAAYFGSLSPTVSSQSPTIAAVTGSLATIPSGTIGRFPISYHWQKDGQPIAGATNISLSFTNAQPTNSGTYTVSVSNSYGTNLLSEKLVVRDVLVLVNGQAVTNGLTNFGPVTVTLQSRFFPNDLIFYTMDGSTPGPSGTQYTGPFQIPSSAIIRAMAYTNTFLQTAFSDTIPLTIIPVFTVSAPSGSGGTVTLSPAGGVYTNQTVVTATATPNPGWAFMGWIGAPLSNSLSASFTVTGNARVTPLFGTSISETAIGNGSISIIPSSPPFYADSAPYILAIPNPGNYFVSWGGNASGTQNPYFVDVASAPTTVSALFAAVPSGKAAFTILIDGDGYVNPVNAGNLFPIGATNLLYAQGGLNQDFLGWSGDASGTDNPLAVTYNKDMVITAHFSRKSSLALVQSSGATGIAFSGAFRTVFRIDTSSNLSTWTPLLNFTNVWPFVQTFFDPTTNAPARFYRAVSQ